MVNESNDITLIQKQASNETDDNLSSVPPEEQEKKTARTRSRAKPRSSRKKTVFPETGTDAHDIVQPKAAVGADRDSSQAVSDISQTEISINEVPDVSRTEDTVEQSPKNGSTKRVRKTAPRSARSTRTPARNRGKKGAVEQAVSPEIFVLDEADQTAPDMDTAPAPSLEMPETEHLAVKSETGQSEALLRAPDAVVSDPQNKILEDEGVAGETTPEKNISAFAEEVVESPDIDNKRVAKGVHEGVVAPERHEECENGGSRAVTETNSLDIPENAVTPDVERESAPEVVESSPKLQKKAKRKMFISVQAGEQAEVVLTEDGVIEEYYVEMQHQAKTKGNIYKGTIHNIDTNLQAAFVSYGGEKNGFLQIDEVHPEYYLAEHEPAKGKKYPLMQKVLRPGQEVLVQVVKEPTGSKGAFLTTYLSLPGRFLVLTPGSEQIGVSRKVDNTEERERLRSLLEGLDPGPGLGVIVRTVSFGASKAALQRDFQYLTRLWKDIRSKGTVTPPPCLLHREPDLAARAVRDYLTEDVNEIWVDDEDTAASICEVISRLFPRRPGLVKTHRDQMQTLWERFSLLKQLEQIYAREVFLPSGGRLVFDQTEALTAIDINSGKTSGKNNFEAMALRTNQEAAEAIARQLRLRDLGGQVVIDFIEMRDRSHWRELEKTMRNAMKVDRARYDVGKISSFGLMELVRQRLGSSALSITMESCPLCRGTGLRRNMEWQSQQALREIKRRLRSNQTSPVVCEFDMELALYLLNNKRGRILELEREFDQRIEIHPRH